MSRILRLLSGGNFLPTEYPNLAIWLDAQDFGSLTFNGSRVSQWNDKSGKSNHFSNGTASFQPLYTANGINNRASVQFYDDSTARFLSAADSATLNYSSFSLFVVIRRVLDVGASETVLAKYTTSGNQREMRLLILAADDLQASVSTDGTSGTLAAANAVGPITLGQRTVLECNYVSTTLTSTINNGGLQTIAASAVFNGTSPVYMGTRDSAAEPFAGHIGEVIFYTSALSSTQRTQVLQYLAQKWNITLL